MQLYSEQKEKVKQKDTIKIKQKFDLKLGKLHKEAQNIKTTQNSNENSNESQKNLLVQMH